MVDAVQTCCVCYARDTLYVNPCNFFLAHASSYTVNFAYNDTQRGIRKVSLFAKCCDTRSLIMYYSGMGLCSGHGHSVVIRELSLYPQSLLAKWTVFLIYNLLS